MNFLFVIWEGGQGAEASDRNDVMQEMGTYVFDLLGKEQLTGGGPLFPAAEGRTVRKRGGKVTTINGPYTETKEVIGGFFLVQADDLDQASEIAAACPAAAYGGVEVRAIMPMG